MAEPLCQTIFDEFKQAATIAGCYPITVPYADDLYRDMLAAWQDIISYQQIDFPETEDFHYNRAWILVPASRNRAKRRSGAQIPVMLVILNTHTRQIQLFKGQPTLSLLNRITEPQMLREIVIYNNLSGYYQRQTSFKTLNNFMAVNHNRLIHQLAAKISQTNQELGFFRGASQRWIGANLTRLATNVAQRQLTEKKHLTLTQIETILDTPTMLFAEEFCEPRPQLDGAIPVKVYNHLIAAANRRAIDFRQGALMVLAPVGKFFLEDEKLWTRIDEGRSVFAAIAEKFSIKSATIKRIIKFAEVYKHAEKLDNVITQLDKIDPALWPSDQATLKYFEITLQLANIYGASLSRTVVEVVALWVKQNKIVNAGGWQQIAENQLALPIKLQVAANQKILADIALNKRNRNRRFRLGQTNLINNDFKTTDFYKYCLAHFTSALTNIGHMKDDLARKILRPVIILACEAAGYNASQAATEALEQKLTHGFWRAATPNEQIEASLYWHSERINFAGRFSSIAHTSNLQKNWEPLLQSPIELKNTILYPLTCGADLRIEADAMAHCVWSYSYNCMAKAYHIFSVCDAQGKRLSTLTVQDALAPNGRRQLKQIQNRSYKNADPPTVAIAAAKELIDAVNTGKLVPDWQAIDAAKAEFLTEQLDLSVGYDFRSPGQRERIFTLYEPCLPRRLLKGQEKSFERLIDVLQIPQQVAAVIAASQAEGSNVSFRPLSISTVAAFPVAIAG